MTSKNTIAITITIRGNPAGVVDALAHGIPLDALRDLHAGMQRELAARRRRARATTKPPNRQTTKPKDKRS